MDCSPPMLFCPWDSPGKNIGVGCHVLLHNICETTLKLWRRERRTGEKWPGKIPVRTEEAQTFLEFPEVSQYSQFWGLQRGVHAHNAWSWWWGSGVRALPGLAQHDEKRQFQEKDAVDATSRTGGSGEQISRANTSTQRSCTELRPLGSMMPVGCPGSRLGSSAAHQQENCSFRQSLIQRCLLVSLFLLPTQKIKS